MKPRIPAGFTLIELLVVIALVAGLGAYLFEKMLVYHEQAEKAAMESVLAAVRSSLQLELARKLVLGGRKDMAALAVQNPMDLMAEVPANYAGVMESAQRPERGLWYFDSLGRQLMYMPKIDNNLIVNSSDRTLRFQVEVLGATEPITSGTLGVRLVSLVKYKWF